MLVASLARHGRGFTARLILAAFLAAAVTAVLQAVATDRLAARAALDDVVAQVRSDAVAVQRQPAGLQVLTARPEIRSAQVVEATGTVERAAAEGRLQVAASIRLDGRNQAAARRAVISGQAQTLRGGPSTVAVVVPMPGDTSALRVVLDAVPAARRATHLRHTVHLVIVVGLLTTPLLIVPLGGRRLARRFRSARKAAGTDDLTGLPSRRAFRRELERQVSRARRDGTPLSIAVLEITGLDGVNETIGRRIGDARLVDVGQLLSRIGDGKRAYRLGGTGFALLLPGLAALDAESVAEQVRLLVREEARPLTATIGVCGLDDRCPDAETLLIGADTALHDARWSTARRDELDNALI